VVSNTHAIITPGEAIVPDENAKVLIGHEIRKELPNGTEDVLEIVDFEYYVKGLGQNEPFFLAKVKRKGSFERNSGGNFNISMSGANSRVNIDSVDHSFNFNISDLVFEEIISAVDAGVDDPLAKKKIIDATRRLEEAPLGKDRYDRYQELISLAAGHMTVFAPFIPALTKFLNT
jgi:hypothetical protein